MRKTFFMELIKLANKDKNIWFLTGDLGYGLVEDFQKKFPERFINVGVAEQNMMNIATGLAMCGKTVFTYSMSTFATMRCYDQIRHYIALNCLRVRIIGIGGKNDYPTLGFSHNCPNDEDLKLMRLLPNFFAVEVGDKIHLKNIMKVCKTLNKPMYIRIER